MFNNQKRTNYYFYRKPSDIIRIITYSIIFIWFALLAHTKEISIIEKEIFYIINRIPFEFSIPIRLIMYLGSVYGVILLLIITLLLKQRRLSRDIFLAGTISWGLNSILKIIINRARPTGIFLDVIVREINKIPFGFPSGHSAVATAIATILTPYISKKMRYIVWLFVFLISVGRIYVGVHLPLDIIGGVLLGYIIGLSLRLILGTPICTLSIESIRKAIEKYRFKVIDIKPLQKDNNSSFSYIVSTKESKDIFVKVSSFEQQNKDLIKKLYNYLIYRDVKGQFSFVTNKQKVEHEAYLMLLAKRSGVHTPNFIFSGELNDKSWIFTEERLNGTCLNKFEISKISERLLISIWNELKLLHQSQIAHKDLRLANIFISSNLKPYIIDFAFAETSANIDDFSRDIVELMIGLSSLIGIKRTVNSTYKVFGKKTLSQILPFLQPLAVTLQTRKILKKNPNLLNNLKSYTEKITNKKEYKLKPLTRINISMIFTIIVSLFAIHLLLPQVGSIENTVNILHTAKYQWIIFALILQSLTYIASSLSLIGATANKLPLGKTILEQLAGLFLSRFTFQGMGGAALDERYLEKSGLKRQNALSTISVIYIINAIIKNFLLILSIPVLKSIIETKIELPKEWPYLLGITLFLILTGLIFILIKPDFIKHKVIKPGINLIRNTIQQIKLIFRKHPLKGFQIAGGLLSVLIIDSLTLFLCIYAFGDQLSFIKTLAIFIGSSMISSAAPTPGGLGAVESSLIIGLTSMGIQTSNAVAGVLTFRLLSFWLPLIPGYISYNYMKYKKII